MDQVTPVAGLTDVDPSHWAYPALRSLVERYGCMVGYPDRTFRGNRAMTRVDALEVRTATLEKQQFSTTAKLSGEVLAYLGDGFGKTASDFNEATFNYRVRLNFDASFSGRDRFRVRLQAANMQLFNAGNPDINNTTGGFGAPQRYASAFPSPFSDETRILPSPASQGANNSSVGINTLSYAFPLGNKLTVFIAAGATDPTTLGADPIVPFSDWALSSISNLGAGWAILKPVC